MGAGRGDPAPRPGPGGGGARPPAQAPRSPQEVRGAALAHARPERRREAPPLGAPGRGLPLPEASLLAHETAVALRWQHGGGAFVPFRRGPGGEVASLRLSWGSPTPHPNPQVSLSAIWACEVTQQLEAGPKGARPWAGAGMGHSLGGLCGRTVAPQSMVRTAPPPRGRCGSSRVGSSAPLEPPVIPTPCHPWGTAWCPLRRRPSQALAIPLTGNVIHFPAGTFMC